MNLFNTIEEKVRLAFEKVGLADYPISLQIAKNAQFGDYQVNGVMTAAKDKKENPRLLAQKIVQYLDSDIFERIEVAGPGFINLHLSANYLAEILDNLAHDTQLGVRKTQQGETVIIDYSSPNLAKEMHVGHLRSTIIGDSISRVLSFLGAKVIAQNHVGDWGTQFGMLVAYLHKVEQDNQEQYALADLEAFYRQAKIKFDQDPIFASQARECVTKIQGGDPEILTLWKKFVDISLSHAQAIYDRLGVLLTKEDVMGESMYNDALKPTVDFLLEKGIAVDEEGTKIVFIDTYTGKDGKPSPFIIQKKDGGFLYSTTDLACIHYNVTHYNPTRLIYVVDIRQSLHFQSLFAVAKQAGWLTEKISAEHIACGTMMGQDGRPFKTRDGGTVKLDKLLDEAESRVIEVVKQKNPQKSAAEIKSMAKILSIGAIKYADLSKNRLSDYIFNWENMLALEGNTSLYLVYAYTRIQSILHKPDATLNWSINITLNQPREKQLAIHLLQFSDTLSDVAKTCSPHYLASYLFNLATLFSKFYEECPILTALEEHVKQNRLKLAYITGKVLKQGLELLGIDVLEHM